MLVSCRSLRLSASAAVECYRSPEALPGDPPMPRFLAPLLVAVLALPAVAEPPVKPDTLSLTLRSRVETFKGSDDWDEVTLKKDLSAKETALVICDMWDKHWCDCATKRCDAIAKKANPVVAA